MLQCGYNLVLNPPLSRNWFLLKLLRLRLSNSKCATVTSLMAICWWSFIGDILQSEPVFGSFWRRWLLVRGFWNIIFTKGGAMPRYLGRWYCQTELRCVLCTTKPSVTQLRALRMFECYEEVSDIYSYFVLFLADTTWQLWQLEMPSFECR